MKVIDPITIAAANLISSTVAEPSGSDPAVWSAATTYGLGAFAYLASTHKVYKSIQAGNLNHDPATDTALATPLWWNVYGPTNRWAMFDQEVNTQSSVTSPLTVVIDPGVVVNALALIELVGTIATISMLDAPAGSTVYSTTVSLEATVVADWYSYFYDPFTQKGSLVLTNLPAYAAGRITVTITGTGTVKCGQCVLGTAYSLGDTQYGASAGIRDYSKKAVDAVTGVVSLTKGKFAKIMRANFRLASGSVNAGQQILTNLRATPCVWVGEDYGVYDPLIVYGWYRDFSLTVDYPSASIYSLEIEGMT